MFWFGDIFYQIWHIIIVGAYAAVGNFYGEDQNFQRVIIDLWRLSCQCLFPPLLAIFQRLWAPLLAAATSWLSSGWWWQAPIKASKANPTWEVFTCHIIEQNLTLHFDITSWCQGTPTWKTSLLFLLQYKTGAGPKAPGPINLFIENILRACPDL